MTEYGVVPEGFRRKPLDRIQFELETAARTIFGPDIVLDAESPMGQFVGLMTLLTAQTWELGEDAYQSYDPDQAEGVRLDTLARMRILRRSGGEDDAEFRQNITNQGRARNDIQDLARALAGLDGVIYSQVFVNDDNQRDENNLAPGTVAIAVLGGDDAEIAETARRYIVPGVSTYGNTWVSSEIDGYCRSIGIVRPIVIPTKLTVSVRLRNDRLGCPPPSVQAIADGLRIDFEGGTHRLLNGNNITLYRVRSAIEGRFPGTVEVVSFFGERDQIVGAINADVTFGFIEMAALDTITIQLVQ